MEWKDKILFDSFFVDKFFLFVVINKEKLFKICLGIEFFLVEKFLFFF